MACQRDVITNPTVSFPFDLELDKIGVIIDERSDAYTVRTHVSLPVPSLPSTLTTGFIRQLKSSSTRRRSRSDSKSYNKSFSRKPPDISLKCKACHNFGHYVTVEDSVCYTLAKAQICFRFLSDPRHAASIKRNTLLFQQNQKDKYTKLKTVTKKYGYMHTLRDDGQSED